MSLHLTARARYGMWSALTGVTDLMPPRIRYGYIHRLTRAAFARPLPMVPAEVHRSVTHTAEVARGADLRCAILADHLDIGGIGAVVEMLAGNLGAAGIQPIIVCPGDGVRAERLRTRGIEVYSVDNVDAALSMLGAIEADAIQLHSAPEFLEDAALDIGLPLIPVMHNTEIHYTARRWRRYVALMEQAESGIAVSETVGAFHRRRLRPTVASRIRVIPNGAPALVATSADDRRTARSALERTIGGPVGDDFVFVCLARFDSQKNVVGTVSAFAAAAAERANIRLVFAGEPSDWAELLRARALADSGAARDRIHLLGNSDAVTLLTAADAFLLDSFFEGWPVAATEALAAGLPLLLSEFGGAAELVAADSGRSTMVANPAGDAVGVTDALVRRARRRATAQVNTSGLIKALVAMADHGRRSERPPDTIDVAIMVEAHAAAIREAAASPRFTASA